MTYYNRNLKRWFKSKKASYRAEVGIRSWRKNQKSQSVISAIILFFIGIYFSIPGPQNIGWMIVDILANSSDVISILEIPFKIAFNLLGVFITIADILYIRKQIQRRNF